MSRRAQPKTERQWREVSKLGLLHAYAYLMSGGEIPVMNEAVQTQATPESVLAMLVVAAFFAFCTLAGAGSSVSD